MPTKRFTLSVVVTISSVFLLSSCSPVPYSNVGLNVPMLKTKGEVNLNASYGATADAEGLGLQAAAAVDSSFAVIASFYYMGNSPHTDWSGKGNYTEFGAGKFGSTINGKFIYDGYLGLGFGGIKNESGNSMLNTKFIKPFLQGSIGFNHKIIDVALTTRFAVVSFTDQSFRFEDPIYTQEAAAFFDEYETKFVFEPGITVRVGYEAIRLSLQYCASTYPIDDRYSNANINTEYFSIGLNALIGKRW